MVGDGVKRPGEGLRRVEEEIVGEKAAALGIVDQQFPEPATPPWL